VCHRHLCDQFKARSVSRIYWSVTRGCPPADSGRVETNIGRDLHDRKKMAAFGFQTSMGRPAASNYRVLRALAGGRAALVEWKLDTGRTHQIRWVGGWAW
jgi:23S rRNA pseudouridine1911/1915/1917 synthase